MNTTLLINTQNVDAQVGAHTSRYNDIHLTYGTVLKVNKTRYDGWMDGWPAYNHLSTKLMMNIKKAKTNKTLTTTTA